MLNLDFYSGIESAVECPGLYPNGDELPYGAIGMAGAAVCFALVYLRLLNECLGVPCCEIVVLETSQDHR